MKSSVIKSGKRWFFQFLLGLVVFIIVYLIAVFALPKITFSGAQENPSVLCYLKSNGSHVDLVMPITTNQYNWLEKLNLEHIEFKDSSFTWVAFGWGDKNFYLNTPTWGDLTFTTAFKAAFWLGSGALHVTYYTDMTESTRCLPFYISEEQSLELFDFIVNDFKLDDSNKPVFIQTDMNYGPRDCFYESKKKYSLFHTCNTWVNDALKSAQSKHCLWTALEFGLIDLYKK